ncbi:hypothetical protein ABZ465_17890 [Streptomyces griseoincarnatus]
MPDHFRSRLIGLLLAAALGVIGEIKDAVVITVVLCVNALTGHAQERRAERSLEALRRMPVAVARIRRDAGCRPCRPAPWYRAASYCWRPASAYRPTGG